MDVAESVRAWKEYMSPFAGRAKLGSMAVTNGADPKGIAYIKRFFDACPECEQECHMAVVHWYDSSQNVAYFKVSGALPGTGPNPKADFWFGLRRNTSRKLTPSSGSRSG